MTLRIDKSGLNDEKLAAMRIFYQQQLLGDGHGGCLGNGFPMDVESVEFSSESDGAVAASSGEKAATIQDELADQANTVEAKNAYGESNNQDRKMTMVLRFGALPAEEQHAIDGENEDARDKWADYIEKEVVPKFRQQCLLQLVTGPLVMSHVMREQIALAFGVDNAQDVEFFWQTAKSGDSSDSLDSPDQVRNAMPLVGTIVVVKMPMSGLGRPAPGYL